MSNEKRVFCDERGCSWAWEDDDAIAPAVWFVHESDPPWREMIERGALAEDGQSFVPDFVWRQMAKACLVHEYVESNTPWGAHLVNRLLSLGGFRFDEPIDDLRRRLLSGGEVD